MWMSIRSWSFISLLAVVVFCLLSGGCAPTPGGSTVIDVSYLNQEVVEGVDPSWRGGEKYAEVYYRIRSTDGQQIIYIVPAGSKDNHMLNNLMVNKTFRVEFYHNEETQGRKAKYILVKSIERID